MSSGARCEEALPGTALGGIAMSILTSYYGNGGAKFSKRLAPTGLRMDSSRCDVPRHPSEPAAPT
jgi:hypothetical protein